MKETEICCEIPLSETHKKKYSLANMKLLMESLPKFSQLIKGLKWMSTKEIIIYKIVIDLLGTYFRVFEGEGSDSYQNEFLPFAIDFYSGCRKAHLADACQFLLKRIRDMFLKKEIDDCMMKRYIEGVMILPANNMNRIQIEMHDNYK